MEDQKASAEFVKNLIHLTFPGMPIEVVRSFKEAHGWLYNKASRRNQNPLGLALVDLGLPDGNGIDIIESIAHSEPDAIPVVLTIYSDDAFLFKALSAGAKGYLLKEEDQATLMEVLKRIEKNEPPLSPAIARRLLGHFAKPCSDEKSQVQLSPREHQTLILLSRGLTVAEVSRHLYLSPQTVSGYVKIIYQKLHVSNRVELIQEANRQKLI